MPCHHSHLPLKRHTWRKAFLFWCQLYEQSLWQKVLFHCCIVDPKHQHERHGWPSPADLIQVKYQIKAFISFRLDGIYARRHHHHLSHCGGGGRCKVIIVVIKTSTSPVPVPKHHHQNHLLQRVYADKSTWFMAKLVSPAFSLQLVGLLYYRPMTGLHQDKPVFHGFMESAL